MYKYANKYYVKSIETKSKEIYPWDCSVCGKKKYSFYENPWFATLLCCISEQPCLFIVNQIVSLENFEYMQQQMWSERGINLFLTKKQLIA